MSLADDVQARLQARRKPNPCKTGIWLTSLAERDRAAFTAFLDDGGPVSHLHRMALKNGCEAAETQFRKHCAKTCSCAIDMESAA